MNNWMQTYTGKQFCPLEPDIDTICIEDIAHALSLKTRFAGHCDKFYSIAQHSCLAMDLAVEDEIMYIDVLKSILLHDAGEAYLPDVVRPIKHLLFFKIGDDEYSSFSKIEGYISHLIHAKFNALGHNGDIVKKYDDIMLATEARDLMKHPPASWPTLPPPRDNLQIVSWEPQFAKMQFLSRFNKLMKLEKKQDNLYV